MAENHDEFTNSKGMRFKVGELFVLTVGGTALMVDEVTRIWGVGGLVYVFFRLGSVWRHDRDKNYTSDGDITRRDPHEERKVAG